MNMNTEKRNRKWERRKSSVTYRLIWVNQNIYYRILKGRVLCTYRENEKHIANMRIMDDKRGKSESEFDVVWREQLAAI